MDTLIYNFVLISLISFVGYYLRQGLTNMFTMQDELRPLRTSKSLIVYLALMLILFLLQILALSYFVIAANLVKETLDTVEFLTMAYIVLLLYYGAGVKGIVKEREKEASI